MTAVPTNISHNGNQNSGKISFQFDPWSASPQKVFGFKHPLLPNDEIFYIFYVEEYTSFSFEYDNFSYSYPTEITINNDSVTSSSIQLWGVGYTVNFYGRFFSNTGNLQGRGILNFPNCLYMDNLEGYGNPFTSLLFPQLIAVNGCNIGGGVQALNAPELVYAGSLQINYMNGPLSSINLPKLKVINSDLYMYNNPNVQSLNFPELVYANGISIDQCQSLTTINVGSKLVLKEPYQKYCNINNAPLNTASVDDLLIAIDNAGQYNGQINLTSLCQPPSAAGVTAKNNLISRGWSVSTN
jgi:hypothetical protein